MFIIWHMTLDANSGRAGLRLPLTPYNTMHPIYMYLITSMALLHNMLISTFCRFNRGYCKGREGLPECGLDDHQVFWRNPAIPPRCQLLVGSALVGTCVAFCSLLSGWWTIFYHCPRFLTKLSNENDQYSTTPKSPLTDDQWVHCLEQKHCCHLVLKVVDSPPLVLCAIVCKIL